MIGQPRNLLNFEELYFNKFNLEDKELIIKICNLNHKNINELRNTFFFLNPTVNDNYKKSISLEDRLGLAFYEGLIENEKYYYDEVERVIKNIYFF